MALLFLLQGIVTEEELSQLFDASARQVLREAGILVGERASRTWHRGCGGRARLQASRSGQRVSHIIEHAHPLLFPAGRHLRLECLDLLVLDLIIDEGARHPQRLMQRRHHLTFLAH